MNHRAEEQQSSRAEDYIYFLNGHNDVVYFADQNFTPDLVESYEYNPWGVLLTSANKNNLLHTAREFEFDAGLQFNRMRYYNSYLGRFMQKDLIKEDNAFIYVRNSPLIYFDPLGLYREGGMIPTLMEGSTGKSGYKCYHATSSCKSPCRYCCIYDNNGDLAGFITTCQCDYLIYCDLKK